MASLSKIIDVHSHPVLTFGEGAPVGEGRKQPDWSVESALSYMEEHDISACVLSAPASANNATGQEARDIARRTNEVLAEIISKHRREGTISRELARRTDQLFPIGAHWAMMRGWVEPHFSSSFGLVPPGVIVVYHYLNC